MSGNVATCTSSESCVAQTRPFARSTSHPAGASNLNPGPRTACHAVGGSDAPDPPQPARIAVASNSASLHRRFRGIRRAITRRKDSASMAKTKDKVYDAAGSVKPYVERAMTDERLRQDVISAFSTAKDLYNELIGGRGAVTVATRVAT